MATLVLRAVASFSLLAFGNDSDILLYSCMLYWKSRVFLPWGLGEVVKFLVVCTIASTFAPKCTIRPISSLLAIFTSFFRKTRGAQWDGQMKPLLFPCRTIHARLFPKKHSFSYSYLLVGIPVGWEGISGGMIASGNRSAAGWYQVHASDYLERGNGHLGLKGKLQVYLKSQGVDPSQYPYAYLVTAARFLGYHFNPVSFWFLYSKGRDMTATILEVNNTFGERRVYFVQDDDAAERMIDDKETGTAKGVHHMDNGPLRCVWPKDFHVSPFNSRKGEYSVAAYDPLAPRNGSRESINVRIDLSSSKGHRKLVALVLSAGAALDPTSMCLWQKVRFLLSWWWVGFATFPRIVKEAATLFFKRKLHVWYRPEPLESSIGRQANKTEKDFEMFFRLYLTHLVSECQAPLTLRYSPGGLTDTISVLLTSPAASNEGSSDVQDEIEFKVLTPVFYSRFMYYAHDLEALFCELNDNSTIWVSRPDLLPKLVLRKPSRPLRISGWFDYGRCKLIQRLRRRPERIVRPMTSSQEATGPPATHSIEDIRDFRPSAMDGFIMSLQDRELRRSYQDLILRLFLADRLAFGSVGLLQLERSLLVLLLAWLGVSTSGERELPLSVEAGLLLVYLIVRDRLCLLPSSRAFVPKREDVHRIEVSEMKGVSRKQSYK